MLQFVNWNYMPKVEKLNVKFINPTLIESFFHMLLQRSTIQTDKHNTT
jgi:hypothetical protein